MRRLNYSSYVAHAELGNRTLGRPVMGHAPRRKLRPSVRLTKRTAKKLKRPTINSRKVAKGAKSSTKTVKGGVLPTVTISSKSSFTAKIKNFASKAKTFGKKNAKKIGGAVILIIASVVLVKYLRKPKKKRRR